MNIAVCLCGSPRNLNRSLESITKISSTGNVKVFLHTWLTKDLQHLQQSGYTKYLTIQPDYYNFLLEKYNAESLILDSFESKTSYLQNIKRFNNIKLTYYEPELLSPYYMLYSMYRVDMLKQSYEQEHSITFDIVYRMRFDSLIQNAQELPLTPFQGEVLAIPSGNDAAGINDQFAYGSSKTMSKYMRLFLNLSTLQGKEFYDIEALLKALIQQSNLTPVRTSLNVQIHNK